MNIRIPFLLVAFTLILTPLWSANVEWLEKQSNLNSIQKKSEAYAVYLRLIVGGSWSPEECYYEIYSNQSLKTLTQDQSDRLLGNKLNHPVVTINRISTNESNKSEAKMDTSRLLMLLEDLERNDVFSLPEHSNRNLPILLPRLEDPYDMVLYLKIEDTETFISRDSSHRLVRWIHLQLKNEWENQSVDTTSVSAPR